ncbi:MAG: SPFH domain-containing protein [Microcoleaceae cyanobacterium]
MVQYFLGIFATFFIGYLVNSSVRIIGGSDEAIVERLGQYNRTLRPGLQFISPVLEKIVYYFDISRERFIDIKPQDVITKDNVPLKIDPVVYWKVEDIKSFYYNVDRIDESISNLAMTSLRAEVGIMTLQELLSSVNSLNQALVKTLDESTSNWGVKITQVRLQKITPPDSIMRAMEFERAAKSQQQAEVNIARGQAEAIRVLSQALGVDPNRPEFMQFLIAQKYVEANQKLSESDNAKIVFMDPGKLNESLSELISSDHIDYDEGGLAQSPKLKVVKPDLKKPNEAGGAANS